MQRTLTGGYWASGTEAPWRGWVSATRLAGFILLSVAKVVQWYVDVALLRRGSAKARAEWLQDFCQRLLWLFGVEARYEGTLPKEGLMVGNHLSYLDIVVLAAAQPICFVSKQEVRDWPGLGVLVKLAGTLFIDRTRRTDVGRANGEVTEALRRGSVVCVFPEGTSSDGREVLPFRSSLLEPAAELGCEITPVHLSYHVPGGQAEQEVCYWGDMQFATHFWRLLGKQRIYARVRYGAPVPAPRDRKALAVGLRREVVRLRHR